MKIVQVLASPGLTGFYFDDQRAIKRGVTTDGFALVGEPQTAGFSAVRQRGESISIMLLLEDGSVAYGDCAAVQYSGAAGRDPLFLARDFIPVIEEQLAPRLVGRDVREFKSLAEEFDQMRQPDGRKFHTAIRYGLTQALLDAVAKNKKITMAEVVAQEYKAPLSSQPIPIFTQTGDDRYDNADKAIIKRADVLPHGLINNLETKLGRDGGKLLEYVSWLKGRVQRLGDGNYRPVIHIDVYGTIGQLFNDRIEPMADYLGKLEQAAAPFELRIEGPIDVGSKEGQIDALARLCRSLKAKGIKVAVVADEWCNTLDDIRRFVDAGSGDMVQIKTPDLGGINNTIEAVLYAKEKGVGAYQGGTCNETERSAQVCVHVAMATRPEQILAKPGMSVDDAMMVVYNEMSRLQVLLQAKGV
ncbi:methylaspartate ammonia-lyase [Desulfofalx alkaliphila]|uniref:methylaspartate ammonia-lyase n=1 Tax=Desulfofalx alkaliphila TaxID=105483 RepID=UPI0004E1C6F6|nr:methylaspartate ammonia-lyase [Desulfofalx alkaliphila]